MRCIGVNVDVEMAGKIPLFLICFANKNAGRSSCLLRNILRWFDSVESKAVCFLHRHKQKWLPKGSTFFYCGQILSYFELLQEDPKIQADMEYFIESYHASQSVEYKNNLVNITL